MSDHDCVPRVRGDRTASGPDVGPGTLEEMALVGHYGPGARGIIATTDDIGKVDALKALGRHQRVIERRARTGGVCVSVHTLGGIFVLFYRRSTCTRSTLETSCGENKLFLPRPSMSFPVLFVTLCTILATYFVSSFVRVSVSFVFSALAAWT